MNHLVSIIIPHLPERQLLCIESIYRQTYPYIEVDIIEDTEGEGAGACRNKGALKSTGDLLFFCDDDILLDSRCIEKMVEALMKMPDFDFVYSDYDRTGTIKGVQKGEYWDFELLKKRNYISTMAMVRREVFFEATFDISLKRYIDWDLWLTLGEKGHCGYYIPEVLFTAVFGETGISLKGPWDRIEKTQILKRKHKIHNYTHSIIIPIHNELRRSRDCIDSVIRNTIEDYELIIVNDASDSETTRWINGLVNVASYIIVNSKQKHHTYCCNRGMECATGEYITLLNNDTLVTYGWNRKLREHFAQLCDAACIGPLTSCCASCQELQGLKSKRFEMDVSDAEDIQKEISANVKGVCIEAKITGFCFFTSQQNIKYLGKFDENIPAGGNEGEWILRAWYGMGFVPYIDANVYVHHFGKASYGKVDYKPLWKIGEDRIVQLYGKKGLDWLEKKKYKDIHQQFIDSLAPKPKEKENV